MLWVVLCARSCALSCALGLVRTSCVQCCADFKMFAILKCLVRGVMRMLCTSCAGYSTESVGLGCFFSNLVRSCAGALGETIPHKTPHNTLYLDKVLCVSCAPGACAKKVLCAPCADLLVNILFAEITVFY